MNIRSLQAFNVIILFMLIKVAVTMVMAGNMCI